jgi:hypothetical protein
MKPKHIKVLCAIPGGTVHATVTEAPRSSSVAAHHKALTAMINAPAANPRRCGAASSIDQRHVERTFSAAIIKHSMML